MERDEFISQVISTINDAEVMTIFFPHLGRSLVVDTRRSVEDGPLFRLMNQVNSMEERMGSIEKMRPTLGKIHSIHGIPWTKSLRTMRDNDVLATIIGRLTSNGMPLATAERQVMDAFRTLLSVEHAQWVDLINGESPVYKTLWEIKSSSPSNS